MMQLETAKRIAHLKELVRQQSQQRLAQAVEKTQQEIRKLSELLRSRQQHEAMREELLIRSQPLPAGYLVQLGQFQQRLEEEVRRQQMNVERAKEQEESKRQEVLDRSVDENRWNKIRQMIYAKYMAEMQRREQKELDDLAGMRYVYRR